MIYVNKAFRFTVHIKTGYYLELLTPETMRLVGSTLNKDKNAENVPHLEIIELALINSNTVNKDYQQSFVYICY